MYQLLLIIHIVIAIGIIGLVLLQHGKGADMGAAFGSGASNTVFGSQGTGSFLFKLTGGLVLAFFYNKCAAISPGCKAISRFSILTYDRIAANCSQAVADSRTRIVRIYNRPLNCYQS